MQAASFSYAQVTYAAGDTVALSVRDASVASFRITSKHENVSGVQIPGLNQLTKYSNIQSIQPPNR